MSSGESKGRILVVSQHFWPEQFRINDLVEFLTEESYEVDVLCGRPNYPSGRFADGYNFWNRRHERYHGASIYRAFEIPRGKNRNFEILLNYISFPISSLFILPQLFKNQYDRIFIYQLSPVMMGLAGIILGKVRKIPTVTYVLDLWPENLFSVVTVRSRILKFLARVTSHWFYKHSDRLIALTNRMRDQLLKVTGKAEHEVIVIPQVAEMLYENLIPDIGLESRFSETFNIVFTGNISPAQSFGTMIDAASILKSKGIHDVKWVIVGDGMSRQTVEQEILDRELTNEFVFEGHHPAKDIPRYLFISDVLVGCLVKSELLEATIPAKVFSYIAAGKPIVLSMDGEAQTLINDEIRCGFAGPTEDATMLAENILKIYYSNKVLRDEFGRRAKTYHYDNFERNSVLHKLVDFIFSDE